MSQIGIFDAGRHVAPDLPVEAVRIGPPDLDGGEEAGLSVQKDSPLVFARPERDGAVGHTLQDRVRLAAQIEGRGGVEEDLLRRQGHPLLRLDDLGLARGSPRFPETTRGHPVGDDRPDRVGRVGDRRLRGLVPPPAPDVPDLHGPLDLGNPGALRPLGLLEQVAIADPLEAHRRERRDRGRSAHALDGGFDQPERGGVGLGRSGRRVCRGRGEEQGVQHGIVLLRMPTEPAAPGFRQLRIREGFGPVRPPKPLNPSRRHPYHPRRVGVV